MADDVVIASRNDLEALLTSMARAHRMVFVAGLPGVGKSLFIRELTSVAHGTGRRPHLLQWDVARPAFVSPAIRARYPDRDGATHPVVRKAIGRWVRKAVLRWHQELDTRALAVEIGAAAPISDPQVPFDPDIYAAVYRHLLRHRNAITVRVDVALEQNGSVYDLPVQAAAILPTGDEAAESLARLEREYTTAEIEADVARWFHSI